MEISIWCREVTMRNALDWAATKQTGGLDMSELYRVYSSVLTVMSILAAGALNNAGL